MAGWQNLSRTPRWADPGDGSLGNWLRLARIYIKNWQIKPKFIKIWRQFTLDTDVRLYAFGRGSILTKATYNTTITHNIMTT